MSIKTPTAYEAQLLHQVAGFESFLVPMCQLIIDLDQQNTAMRQQLEALGQHPPAPLARMVSAGIVAQVLSRATSAGPGAVPAESGQVENLSAAADIANDDSKAADDQSAETPKL